jgi:transcriptional regulator with XRE-family HTH domain
MQTTKNATAVQGALHLGAALARCRAEKKLRLADVAKELDLGVATLSRIERGDGNLHRTTQLVLEDFLRKCGYLPKERKLDKVRNVA